MILYLWGIVKRNIFRMIYLSYKYFYDVFENDNSFKTWVKELLGINAFKVTPKEIEEMKFEFTTFKISVVDFEKLKSNLKTSNLVQIQGVFDICQKLSLGVRNFKNTIE